MASVTSLGLHQPAGLQHAIQEQLLPNDADATSCTWHSTWDIDDKAGIIDDELLVTPRCVIWSRGGVFRKSYNFDLENEPVTQALLTSFPTVDPLLAKDGGRKGYTDGASTKSVAMVVFLKTQAHIYFLSGTNHVIHLPFEVESAFAAPQGIIIQRKFRVDSLVSASLKFPKVPASSFVSNHPQPWSAATSQRSTFSIADLNAPRPMPLPVMSTFKDTWDPPALKDDSTWPRLFSLSDPLSEMGLVVAEPSKSENPRRRRSSAKFKSLDTSEEILYVSRRNEVSFANKQEALTIAVTFNQITSTYTVWRMSYLSHDISKREKHRVSSGAMSRRRSSFIPGSGATTPIPNGQRTFRESFGGNLGGLNSKRGNQGQDMHHDEPLDLASALNPDFDSAIPRRKSRRVSSMLARSDLSASHDRSAFTELASGHPNTISKRGGSLGGQSTRKSSGPYLANGHSSQFSRSMNSFLEAPIDDLLDELSAGGDFEGFHNMGLEDVEFDALKQEIAFSHICSVAAENHSVRFSSQHVPATKQRKLVVINSPECALDDPQASSIVICVLDSEDKRLLIINLLAKVDGETQGKPGHQPGCKISLPSAQHATGVVDICKLDDGNISRLLVLNQSIETGGHPSINLQAPWSYTMPLTLPHDFMVHNVRTLGHDALPGTRREEGHRRVFSHNPVHVQGLRDTRPRGVVAVVDDQGNLHKIQIAMQPRNSRVRRFLDVCRAVLPGSKGGEGLLVGWWCILQWLRCEPRAGCVDLEWTAFVMTLFSLVLSSDKTPKQGMRQSSFTQRKARGSFTRSSSGAQAQPDNFKEMLKYEASGNFMPVWMENSAWNWIAQQETDNIFPEDYSEESFLQTHIGLAREFVASEAGQSVAVTLPPWNQDPGNSRAAVVNVIVGLHLLREEEKLDIMIGDSSTMQSADLLPVLFQLARWLNWTSWAETYSADEFTLLEDNNENSEYSDQILTIAKILQGVTLSPAVPEPTQCPSIFDWIQTCLLIRGVIPFPCLADLVKRASTNDGHCTLRASWESLTPRTLSFRSFFSSMRPEWSSAQTVEALSVAGMTPLLLQTLPEALLAPLQESLAQCQAEPPTTWPKELLAMVCREDVTTLLTPRHKPRNQSTMLVCRRS